MSKKLDLKIYKNKFKCLQKAYSQNLKIMYLESMTIARKDIIRENADGTYHCVARCVRRSFLCGFDKYAQKCFEHRKDWIKDRIIFLSKIFSVEILAYAIMDNHFHLVITLFIEALKDLTDEEILQRWNLLFPKRRDSNDIPVELSKSELECLLLDKKRICELRNRLSNVSWFMRCLNEYIARRANKEDDCKGRFWEGRFKCQALLDEGSILACMAYVDLNPIRAGIKDRPEESKYTSVNDRIAAKQAKEKIIYYEKQDKNKIIIRQQNKMDKFYLESNIASWLSPFKDGAGVNNNRILSIELNQYLALIDWTGRQIKKNKKGKIPSDLSPILTRLEINNEQWVTSIENYGKLFYRVVGRLDRVIQFAANIDRLWFKGKKSSRALFSYSS